ncbi:hypothetical protein B296_00034960 [Ensete ventricosum]|uniref:Uncharacterized protein n=1 Tax=Ensete ventricosum TaxID=4639 RepID=A0A426ZYT1_ENSVE|nr:hypothetical protein B296_00034960 [Ensete ventricosum]
MSYYYIKYAVAWLIGWALILEYTIGGSAVARGISPNLALFFGGPDSLPSFLARVSIPGLDVVVDPCAAILVFVVTGLLCLGIKEVWFAILYHPTRYTRSVYAIPIADRYTGIVRYSKPWSG